MIPPSITRSVPNFKRYNLRRFSVKLKPPRLRQIKHFHMLSPATCFFREIHLVDATRFISLLHITFWRTLREGGGGGAENADYETLNPILTRIFLNENVTSCFFHSSSDLPMSVGFSSELFSEPPPLPRHTAAGIKEQIWAVP